MPTVPIYITQPEQNAAAKYRSITLIMLDMHALGIRELDGVAIPQLLALPKCEPGDCFEVVLVKDHAELVPIDVRAPSLLNAPKLLICDTDGHQGEIAAATITE